MRSTGFYTVLLDFAMPRSMIMILILKCLNASDSVRKQTEVMLHNCSVWLCYAYFHDDSNMISKRERERGGGEGDGERENFCHQ